MFGARIFNLNNPTRPCSRISNAGCDISESSCLYRSLFAHAVRLMTKLSLHVIFCIIYRCAPLSPYVLLSTACFGSRVIKTYLSLLHSSRDPMTDYQRQIRSERPDHKLKEDTDTGSANPPRKVPADGLPSI